MYDLKINFIENKYLAGFLIDSGCQLGKSFGVAGRAWGNPG